MSLPETMETKLAEGRRLSAAEGVMLLRDGDLLELGR